MWSTFLGILPLIALRLLQHFSCSQLNPKADLALEEAGLTPGPAESTLLVGWLGDMQGACLRDESPVAGDEERSLLYGLQEILLRLAREHVTEHLG